MTWDGTRDAKSILNLLWEFIAIAGQNGWNIRIPTIVLVFRRDFDLIADHKNSFLRHLAEKAERIR